MTAPNTNAYSAEQIEVLEGLEAVRHRPGMYIGGTDDRAFHHLAAEILDNSMDEAVAGYATRIEVALLETGALQIRDNGRGIPTDSHPKFPDKSALEVILTTLHSGGKFSGKAYATSGGLHGVGLSVVNALSRELTVESVRDGRIKSQNYARGLPLGPLTDKGETRNRRGTTITFVPDPDIFGATAQFEPSKLLRMARSKAYLFRGVEIRWSCAPEHLSLKNEFQKPENNKDGVPQEARFHFPGGLGDYLCDVLKDRPVVQTPVFSGQSEFPDEQGRMEWAIAWPDDNSGFCHSYLNTIPTPNGGTHETGMRFAATRAFKAFGDLAGLKKAAQITADDIIGEACILLSVFIREPQFQGQTKEKLSSPEATKFVDAALRDAFDLWLAEDTEMAKILLNRIIEKAEDRLRKKEQREVSRKSATRRLRLPGKLADCSNRGPEGTEIFLVEGDSAGGSAKQARDRATQAILPLRGKILNVASASAEKLKGNQEINDLTLALGCGTRGDFNLNKLRYERVIIMTDADVDGAHIATLLMTFFYREMPSLIDKGHLYLAQPPLYRLATSGGGKKGGLSVYAQDEAHKDKLLETHFKGRKVEISRFKGLGEMPPAQLKTTTMSLKSRTLLKVQLADAFDPQQQDEVRRTARLVETLMGKKPELRFDYIQRNAAFVEHLDI